MSDYKYERPEGKLHKVSVREWNKVFGSRGIWPFIYVEIYVDGDTVISHYLYTIWAKLCITALYPILTICEGYRNANKKVYRAWKEKKTGSFSSDTLYRRHRDSWEKMERLIGERL